MPALPVQTGLHDAAAGVRDGVFSSAELVDAALDAIRAANPSLNAFSWVDEDAARAQAAAADRARAAGSTAPLLGVPVAVKDNLNVLGQPCTCGSRILEGYTALYDATVIARLRAAGAVIIGRTNMDEFAMGSSTETSCHGPTRNPADPERVAGGSSGGSAAAVAAGLVPAALGSDTGGSIRQPASFCGCVGLKPSYGRVSRYGLVAYASSLDQIGPLTRDVRDAALVLGAIAGHDPADATCLDRPVPDYTDGLAGATLRGVRIGIPAEFFAEGLEPGVAAVVRGLLDRCTAAGAIPVEVRLPRTPQAIATYYVIATAEASANLARFDGVRYGRRAAEADSPIALYRRSRAEGFGVEVKRRIILGTYVLSSGYYDAYYLRAQKVRTLIRRDYEEAFARCDVIAGPVAPTPAFRLGEKTGDPLQMYLGDTYTVPTNLAGICGLSLPAGRTAGGLPVGLHLQAPAFEEPRLLRVAASCERLVREGRA